LFKKILPKKTLFRKKLDTVIYASLYTSGLTECGKPLFIDSYCCMVVGIPLRVSIQVLINLKIMKWNVMMVAGSLAALVLAGCDKDEDDDANTVNAQDQSFAVQASMSNRAEVELGALAQTKSSDASVRNYAQMMVTDHTAAQNELTSIAGAINLGVGITDSLSTMHKGLRDSLMVRTGRAFDSVYIKSQVRAHQMSLVNFQSEENGGMNTQLKAYASKYRPGIQMHLVMADTISTRVRR
jgi:putative membrane protein